MGNKIQEEIYREVVDGYFTNENFMREDKGECVKRAIDLTIKKINKLISEAPDVDYIGEYLKEQFAK